MTRAAEVIACLIAACAAGGCSLRDVEARRLTLIGADCPIACKRIEIVQSAWPKMIGRPDWQPVEVRLVSADGSALALPVLMGQFHGLYTRRTVCSIVRTSKADGPPPKDVVMAVRLDSQGRLLGSEARAGPVVRGRIWWPWCSWFLPKEVGRWEEYRGRIAPWPPPFVPNELPTTAQD